MHPTITFSGNLAAKPVLRVVEGPQGPSAVANMRVAVTPRRKVGEEWTDGETIWFKVSAWRTLGANCAASLNTGDRVVVRGRLSQHTWRDAEGAERSSFEVEADQIGLDISRHVAMVVSRAPEQRTVPAEAAEIVEAEEHPVAV